MDRERVPQKACQLRGKLAGTLDVQLMRTGVVHDDADSGREGVHHSRERTHEGAPNEVMQVLVLMVY